MTNQFITEELLVTQKLAMSFVLKRGFPGASLRVAQTLKTPVSLSLRTYASKNKGKTKQATFQSEIKGSHASSTSGLIPTSQRALADETAQAEYDKTSTKMVAAVDWLRKEVAGIKARATGHVTPAILDPVRVTLPDDSKEHRIEEVATVGVREGSNLIVTLYEDNVCSRELDMILDAALSYCHTFPEPKIC